MIQEIISRMGANSFLLKGWSVTLVSALFALAAVDANPRFVFLTYFPAFAFWALDGYFLRQEKLFRKLHDHVSSLPESEIDFSMDTSSFQRHVGDFFEIAWSKTLRLFHGTLVGAILVVMLLMMHAARNTSQ
jgi:hypothetical protein